MNHVCFQYIEDRDSVVAAGTPIPEAGVTCAPPDRSRQDIVGKQAHAARSGCPFCMCSCCYPTFRREPKIPRSGGATRRVHACEAATEPVGAFHDSVVGRSNRTRKGWGRMSDPILPR